MKELITKEFIEYFSKRLEMHHKMYDTPVSDVLFEENLKNTLETVFNEDVDWDQGSHKIGADIFSPKLGKISCKSGSWKYSKTTNSWSLNISGSRTTKYKTIEEKKEFLKIKKEDVYFCLSRVKEEWECGEKKYYLSIFENLNHGDLEWKETLGVRGKYKEKHNGWKAENKDMKCVIKKDMSDQLWTTLKEDAIEQIYPITIG